MNEEGRCRQGPRRGHACPDPGPISAPLRQHPSPLHHSERWRNASTGEWAILHQWRGEAAKVAVGGLELIGPLDDLRRQLRDMTYVSLDR